MCGAVGVDRKGGAEVKTVIFRVKESDFRAAPRDFWVLSYWADIAIVHDVTGAVMVRLCQMR